MNGLIKWSGVLIFCFLIAGLSFAQSSVDKLKKEQAKLEEKIAYANKLLSENKDRRKDTEWQIALLAKKIESRQLLIQSISAELHEIRKKEKISESEIAKLKEQKNNLTDAYGKVLRTSYRSKLLKNRWVFLFTAQSLPQLYRRWRYLRQLNDGVGNQLHQITETVKGIDLELQKLKHLEADRDKALASEEHERKILNQDVERHKGALKGLSKEASRLNTNLKEHRQAQAKLKSAILNAIASTSEERKNMPLTPAMTRLSSSFASNKGSLPWPVSRGLIVKAFGRQVHPTLRNVTIVNNGVDISTDPGAVVKAVFDGTVVGQQYIPGYDHMVIISHGAYYSVYSYLSTITVGKGEKIKTGETIGLSRNLDGTGQIHLEIWHGKELLDPQSWLKDH
ncbi:MAG: peptidoglycan DD-metalloendopeptidase family protein [Saprospiraceae bacterium]|nr:peptidoglycan DD-metalloendopeptidase family protein [Saprospiraceae bacterium]